MAEVDDLLRQIALAPTKVMCHRHLLEYLDVVETSFNVTHGYNLVEVSTMCPKCIDEAVERVSCLEELTKELIEAIKTGKDIGYIDDAKAQTDDAHD